LEKTLEKSFLEINQEREWNQRICIPLNFKIWQNGYSNEWSVHWTAVLISDENLSGEFVKIVEKYQSFDDAQNSTDVVTQNPTTNCYHHKPTNTTSWSGGLSPDFLDFLEGSMKAKQEQFEETKKIWKNDKIWNVRIVSMGAILFSYVFLYFIWKWFGDGFVILYNIFALGIILMAMEQYVDYHTKYVLY
jgi:hypothetical protein